MALITSSSRESTAPANRSLLAAADADTFPVLSNCLPAFILDCTAGSVRSRFVECFLRAGEPPPVAEPRPRAGVVACLFDLLAVECVLALGPDVAACAPVPAGALCRDMPRTRPPATSTTAPRATSVAVRYRQRPDAVHRPCRCHRGLPPRVAVSSGHSQPIVPGAGSPRGHAARGSGSRCGSAAITGCLARSGSGTSTGSSARTGSATSTGSGAGAGSSGRSRPAALAGTSVCTGSSVPRGFAVRGFSAARSSARGLQRLRGPQGLLHTRRLRGAFRGGGGFPTCLVPGPETVTRGSGSVFGSRWLGISVFACSASIAAWMRCTSVSDRSGLTGWPGPDRVEPGTRRDSGARFRRLSYGPNPPTASCSAPGRRFRPCDDLRSLAPRHLASATGFRRRRAAARRCGFGNCDKPARPAAAPALPALPGTTCRPHSASHSADRRVTVRGQSEAERRHDLTDVERDDAPSGTVPGRRRREPGQVRRRCGRGIAATTRPTPCRRSAARQREPGVPGPAARHAAAEARTAAR